MVKELPGITVLDFDGTVTNAEAESVGVIASYDQLMADKVGIGLNELVEMLEKARQKIINNPGVYGWVYNGIIVAPATSDPYILHQTSATLVIEELRNDTRNLHLPSNEELSNFQNMLFQLSYPNSGIHFKPGARDFIQKISSLGTVMVVTNSKIEEVMKKLNLLLGEGHGLQIVGEAKKYVVNPSWTEIAESVHPIADFPRPVFLRRPKYHGVLTDLKDVKRVAGDIYELDLALPEYMGMTTVLVANSMTPGWERNYYQAHPNGFAVEELEAIVPGLLALESRSQ